MSSSLAPREFIATVKLRIDERSKRLVAVLTSDDLPDIVQLSPAKNSSSESALSTAHLWTQLVHLRPKTIVVDARPFDVEIEIRDDFLLDFILSTKYQVRRYTFDARTRVLHHHHLYDSVFEDALLSYSDVLAGAIVDSTKPDEEAIFVPAAALQPGTRIQYGQLQLMLESVVPRPTKRVVLGLDRAPGRSWYTLNVGANELVQVVPESAADLRAQLSEACSQQLVMRAASGRYLRMHQYDTLDSSIACVGFSFAADTEELKQETAHHSVVIDTESQQIINQLLSVDYHDLTMAFPTLLDYAGSNHVETRLHLLPRMYPSAFESVHKVADHEDRFEIRLGKEFALGGFDRVVWLILGQEKQATMIASRAALKDGRLQQQLAQRLSLEVLADTDSFHPGNRSEHWREAVIEEVASWELVLLGFDGVLAPLARNQITLVESSERGGYSIGNGVAAVPRSLKVVVISALAAQMGQTLNATDPQAWEKVRQLVQMAADHGQQMHEKSGHDG